MINIDLLTAVTLGIFLASVIQTTVNYGIGKITYKKRRALLDKEYADFKQRMAEVQEFSKTVKEETK